MQKSAIHKARDLSPELRQAAEALLGQALEDNETVTLRASKGYIIKEAPTGKTREEAFQRLFDCMDKMADHAKDVPENELNALIDQALAETRIHRR